MTTTKKTSNQRSEKALKAKPDGGKTPVDNEEKATEQKEPLFAFQFELNDVKPKIWRKFFVPSTISLAEFSEVIIRAMGWNGYHLSSFTIHGKDYYNPDTGNIYIGLGPSNLSTSEEYPDLFQIKLNSLGLKKNNTIYYLYDFGASWEHTLKLLDTDYKPNQPDQRLGCYDGERACPPEDCGGHEGFEEFLEIISDPNHEDYEEMLDLTLEGEYDPEKFDLELTSRRVSLALDRSW